MGSEQEHIDRMNGSIRNVFRDSWRAAWRVILKDPRAAAFIVRAAALQKRAARLRAQQEGQGVHVPPFMIVSITHQCNLQCKGCYARAQHRGAGSEMTEGKLRGVLNEARELGISVILLAGGEPFTRREILAVTRDYPEMIFLIFTNGLLINDDTIRVLRTQRHVIPVISLEGHAATTDARRGAGVFEQLSQTLAKMKRRGLFFGTSLTTTCDNFSVITSESYVRKLMELGSRIFYYVEYVPVEPGTEGLVLSVPDRQKLLTVLDDFRRRLPGLFIAFPGDEESFGGCLAAGRGFVHISPEGSVEPCPFAPFSDADLGRMSLKEALGSELLRTIRESDQLHAAEENAGGCVLWEKREWVKSLLH